MKTIDREEQTHIVDTVPVAIVGMGSIFPQADNTSKFWTNIIDRVDAITEVPETHWRPADYYDQDPKVADKVYAKLGGFLSPIEFKPMDYGILPNAIEAIDTSQILGLLAVEQALNDAGYSAKKEFDRERVSVIIGITGTLELVVPLGARLGYPQWKEALADAGVDKELADDVIKRISDSYVPWQENSFPGLLGNVVAGRISKHFNFGGTNCTVDAACGSSLSALNLAILELSSGRSDMAVAGGIDTFNDIFMYTCFSKTPALSPSGHARPYSSDSDGTTLSEGLGILVLKRLDDAERDGDNIYAVVKGIGASSDGSGSAIYEPSAKGQAKALRRAYQQGGITPDTVELIEGHGTGTKVGDAVEVNALHDVFGKAEKPWCALGSIKSQIGHAKAAAGVAGLIKASLALYHKVLPPTIKVDQPAESLTTDNTPFYVNTTARPWVTNGNYPRRAGVSALGFGGSNFHCLLEEYQADKQVIDWDGNVQIVPFSAPNDTDLKQQLSNYDAEMEWSQLRLDADKRRQQFNRNAASRLVLVVEKDQTKRTAQINNGLTLLVKNSGKTTWDTPDGIYYGSGTIGGTTAMLFPGQGAQYPGMLKCLALQFPQFIASLISADSAFATNANTANSKLADAIYPLPAFSSAATQNNIDTLQATEIAQPALGAVSLAAAEVVAHFGITTTAVAGHSYGELVALCAAKVFSSADLHQLSRLRGVLMAGSGGDRGSMVAVSAPLSQVEDFLREEKLDLVLANRNTPEQAVLSGATSEIEKAIIRLKDKGISHKQLSVAAAFHSKLIADAAQPFAEKLIDIDFNDPQIAVFSNTIGGAYPDTATAVRDLLAEQLANSVDFVAEIKSMYQVGVRTFIEVGPGGRLTGMVKAILGDREYQAIALDSSNGRRSGSNDLARMLAQVAVLGKTVDLALWDAGYAANQPEISTKKGLSVSICGANFYKKPAKRPPLQIKQKPVAASVAAPPSANVVTPLISTSGVGVEQKQSTASLQEALRITQQSMQALQSLQEQTSKLHQQFLEGQQQATNSFMQLVTQQQQLAQGASIPANIVTQTVVQPVVTPVSVNEPAIVPPTSAQLTPVVPEPVATAVVTATVVDIAPQLLEIIAEKTGYPVDMLELDMALDTDLGIDSIKRVEILSALQEKIPNAPVIRPEDLGALQTLGQIVTYLEENSTIVATPQTNSVIAPNPSGGDRNKVEVVLLAVIADKTGYPVEMLELDMALDTDLGIDSIKRVEILSALQEKLPELPPVRPEDLGVLQTLGQIIDHLCQGAENVATVVGATATVAIVATVDRSVVTATLLAVIADKTGYPVEMLELDMALDTDLGIDSIKRVEILSALQEKLPELPAVRPEDLGVLQTLGQITDHLCKVDSPPAANIPAAPTMEPVDRQQVATVLLDVIADKTGYPVEMLELDMALDTDLGIDSIKRVEILSTLQQQLPGAPAIKPEHLGTLQTVGQIVDFLASISGTDEQGAANKNMHDEVAAAKGIVREVLRPIALPQKRGTKEFGFSAGAEVWITDDGSSLADAICARLTARQIVPRKVSLATIDNLTLPESLAGLVVLAPLAGSDDDFLHNAFKLFQLAEPALQQSTKLGGAFFATVSRLDGYFGLDVEGKITDPLSGGLAGLSKTAALECPTIHCKAFDLAMGMEILPTATALVDEIFSTGAIEVGISTQGLHGLELVSAPLSKSAAAIPIVAGDLVVVSGGARGVTAAVAIALSEATKATLLLLGRTELADVEPNWLAGVDDEGAIKKALIANADAPLKPRDVATQYQHIVASREIRTTLERILNSGGNALYRSIDLRDHAAVVKLIAEISTQYGAVKGIIHGAGVLADKLIKEKTSEQFEQVYSTKVVGIRSLLTAVNSAELKFMALFSSSTGRFGRIGQVDYAVANEVLNKIASQHATANPDCRVLSLNWGPWDGGMVTPALKKVFAQEGIEVIDLQAGADYLINELATPPGGAVELVISGGDEVASVAEPVEPHQNICVSKAFDLDIDIEQYPFLQSHVIDGKAVLPMAIIIEWLAHGAIHNNPGMKFQGFNDLRILKGVIVEPNQAVNLQIMTGKAFKVDGVHVVPVELSGIDNNGKTVAHARAKIVLAGRLPQRKTVATKLDLPAYPHPSNEIYRSDRLFHGAAFQGIREVIGSSVAGINALVNPAPLPQQWIEQPLRNSWLADPLALDSSFQMLILWSFEQYKAASLPVFTGRYRQYQQQFPSNGVEIRVQITEQNSHRAIANIDFIDPIEGQLVARIENYECVIDASLNATFQKNKLIGVA